MIVYPRRFRCCCRRSSRAIDSAVLRFIFRFFFVFGVDVVATIAAADEADDDTDNWRNDTDDNLLLS